MVEGDGGGGPEPGPGSKPASRMESAGGRLRFRVELRPEETTIVSWKKLLREANLSDSTGPGQLNSGPSSNAPPQPISQAMPPPLPVALSSSKQPTENEQKDSQGQAGTNRLSSVIERIERMYAGDGSSDGEDDVLDNVPDDDEYDTEDSFIDDAELDDYFKVDNSAIKHDGFFVNRGKLERIESTAATNCQPKKRRHKDSEMGRGSDDGQSMSKIVKTGNKGKKAPSSHHMVAMTNMYGENMQCQASSAKVPEVSTTDKNADSRTTVDPSGVSNGDAISKGAYADQQRPGVPLSKKRKESNNQDDSTQRSNNKCSHVSKSSPGKQPNNIDHLDQSIQPKGKGGFVERFDLNTPASSDSLGTMTVVMPIKEGSSVRPKSMLLEKAIKELEKIVAEFRPPSTEFQDPDNSSQAVKRRLPPEIKQKLAKVARIVQQSNVGKIPKDVINRLMSIVGHLMQVRTLKRNLKVLANTGLSAKQEKDEKIQKIKQEVAEMVRLRVPYIRSKAELPAENSNDFQEAGLKGNKALKSKYKIDHVLENKICNLYDFYVKRLEEDSGPPVRRLYEELVSFWPSGFIDANGIKRAIYRAKDRMRACSLQKDQEKKKKRKALPARLEPATNVNQASHMHEHLLPGSHDHITTSTSNPVPSATAPVPVTSSNDPNMDKTKQEKLKEGPSNNPTNATPSNALPKNKLKRKPNVEVVKAQIRLGKLAVDERPKHHKQVAVPQSKQNLLPAVPPA